MHNFPLCCMNRHTSEQIGNTIGKILEVDVQEDDMAWGRCLRVKIECDLRNTIARGRTVNLQGRRIWVPL